MLMREEIAMLLQSMLKLLPTMREQ